MDDAERLEMSDLHWPLPSARRRLASALTDLGVLFAICLPLLVRGFAILQGDLRDARATCLRAHQVLSQCLQNQHVNLVQDYAISVFVIVGGIGLLYFAILQSSPRRRSVGEWAARVLVVKDSPRTPLTRPSAGPAALRFGLGLLLCVPICVIGLELWLDEGFGLVLLGVLAVACVLAARLLLRGIMPDRDSGAMPWDRWTGTLVVTHDRPGSSRDPARDRRGKNRIVQ